MSDVPEPSRPRSFWRHPLVLIVTAVSIVAVAASARLYLQDLTDARHFDPTPLPRPKLNAPFIKSADSVVNEMIEIADIEPDDLVYDLGCGDGKIVIAAAVQRGCRGVGFDINPERIAEAQANAEAQGVEHLVSFREADIFQVDLRESDVVVMYLLPWMVKELVPQFQQCRPGTRIVSHDWKIEGLEEDKSVEVELPDDSTHRVFLYVTPLRPARSAVSAPAANHPA